MIGQRFGKLVVLEETAPHTTPKGRRIKKFLCQCDCGVKKPIMKYNLTTNKSISCGCYHKEKVTTHGYTDHPLYRVWADIKTRCYSPTYRDYRLYGGRGILVCNEWLDPKSFIEWGLSNGWSKGLEIDRINVNGDYEPSNCRFIDESLQMRNKRGYGTSPYRGVCWDKKSSKWIAQASLYNNHIRLGSFTTELDALAAVNHWHRVNFPDNIELIQDI